jgi:hypothetical protein
MSRRLFTLCLFSLIGATFQCTSSTEKSDLSGFIEGKKRMRYELSADVQSYPDGSRGYYVESLVTYSAGQNSSGTTFRKSWLNDDYSLRRSLKVENYNGVKTYFTITREGDTIGLEKKENDTPLPLVTVDCVGPVYVEILPQLLLRDLPEKGEKTFPVYYDKEHRVVPLKARCLGPTRLQNKHGVFEALHYQIEAITAPGEFDGYFIDPENAEILQIQFGDILFIKRSFVG